MATPINELKSFTEYTVSTPTSVFPVGFQYNYDVDHINVYVDGVEATVAGYTITHDTHGTLELTPVVPSGIVRVERETNIDTSAHTFSAGAKFIAANMDENFQQIRHSQQEVRDGFVELEQNTAAGIAAVYQAANDAQNAATTAQVAANTATTSEAAIKAIVVDGKVSANAVIDVSGKTQQQINDVSVKEGDYPPVLAERSIRLDFNYARAALRYGMNDPLPLDNNKNMFRGLANKDAWAAENIGVGSVAFGRNGASYAYLGTTFGHDCITFGVASTAGGAGTGTGNPDAPTDGATYGYCSFAHGKDTLAMGRISYAFGRECVAGSIYSSADGYRSISGAGLTSHPNGVASDGNAASAKGFYAEAYGDYAIARGAFVRAYNGAHVYGSGINTGSPLVNSTPNSIAFGRNTDVGTLFIGAGDGTNGGFGKIGINTTTPRERVEVKLKSNDVVAFRTPADGVGKGIIDFQGTLTGDVSASIFRMEYTSPNIGSAVGVTDFYQNGINCLSFNSSGDMNVKRILRLDNYLMIAGKKIIGGQLAAIADSTGTAADNQRATFRPPRMRSTLRRIGQMLKPCCRVVTLSTRTRRH